MTKEIRSPNVEERSGVPRPVRHSDFGIPSDFVIRHSDLRIAVHGKHECAWINQKKVIEPQVNDHGRRQETINTKPARISAQWVAVGPHLDTTTGNFLPAHEPEFEERLFFSLSP